MTIPIFILLSGAAVAAGRFTITGRPLSWVGTYEAFAHIWVGFVAGVVALAPTEPLRAEAVVLLLILTVLEVIMFALDKAKRDRNAKTR